MGTSRDCDSAVVVDELRKAILYGAHWDDGCEAAKAPLSDLSSVLDVRHLRAVAQNRAHGGTVAVTFVSREYRQIGVNWVAAMDRIGWRHYIVIAGDQETQDVLSTRGVTCVRANVADHTDSLPYLNRWGFTKKGLAMTALKFPVAAVLLSHGLDVLLSDADATWTRSPMQEIGPDVDVAFQRVFYHPDVLAKVWSFAACTGFVFLRSSSGSHALVNDCIREHRHVQCDQLAMNLALLSAGTTWQLDALRQQGNSATLEDDPKNFFRAVARVPISGRIERYNLPCLALPHHTFWRHDWVPASPDEIIVCHPNTAKKDTAKIRRCEELGVRFCRSD